MKKPWEGPRIEETELEAVLCPNQPGRLIISSRSCAERYSLAQEREAKFPKDEFGLAIVNGLKSCKHCPEGRYFWQNRDWPHLPRRFGRGKRFSCTSLSQGDKEGIKGHPEKG